MARHLPGARRRIARFAHQAKHELARGQAPRQHERQITVIRDQPIRTSIQGEAGRHLSGLMADPGDMERDLALPVEHPGALVEASGQQHHPVHLEQGFVG